VTAESSHPSCREPESRSESSRWRLLSGSTLSPKLKPTGSLVLTDDLALRRLLESHGATVAGTFGILVRAYSSGRLRRDELEEAVEALFHRSSLHLSRAFRIYIQELLKKLP
jgi:predicted nucleic acid-binding protein